METTDIKTRLYWVDITKIIGMYLIVLGHYSPSYSSFIYSFSVPLFFITSGYLNSTNKEPKVFYLNLWKKLILPSVVLLPFHWLWQIPTLIGNDFSVSSINCVFFSALYGSGSALSALWFVYTLLIIKVLWYCCNKSFLILLNILCIIVAYIIKERQFYVFNAIVAISTALPFFSIGVLAKHYNVKIDSKNLILLLVLAMSLCLTFSVSCLNGEVWMYKACYGNDIALFLTGGICGTIMIVSLSKLLEKALTKSINEGGKEWLLLMSNGTLMMLGLQWSFIHVFDYIGLPRNNYFELLYALVIVLCHFPILLFCKKYLPLLAR